MVAHGGPRWATHHHNQTGNPLKGSRSAFVETFVATSVVLYVGNCGFRDTQTGNGSGIDERSDKGCGEGYALSEFRDCSSPLLECL
jgi:hypothetical protein